MEKMDLMGFLDLSNWESNVSNQFCFTPTSSELIGNYLKKKILGELDPASTPIVDIDMYGKKNPWDLFGDDLPWQRGGKLFVFTVLSSVGKTNRSSNKQKNRVAGNGSWRVNNKEHPVFDDAGNQIGYQRALTFKPKQPTVGQWNMDEFSIDPAAYPDELRGCELYCQNMVLCRISSNSARTKNVELSKKRKVLVHDDDYDDSCVSDVEHPTDLIDEASSKRQRVAAPQEETTYVPQYIDPQEQTTYVPQFIDFDPNMDDSEFVDVISFDYLE